MSKNAASFWLVGLVALLTIACSPLKKPATTRTTLTPKSGRNRLALRPTAGMQLRANITTSARAHLGTAYKYAGRRPDTGFDCSGFTCFVMEENRVRVSPSSASQGENGRYVPLEKVQPGDLIFFGEGGKVSHVALVTRRSSEGIFCIHSTSSRGVIEENISASAYWEPKILFARDVVSRR